MQDTEKFMSALSSTDVQGQFESFNAKDYPSIDGEISHYNKLIMHAAKISLVTLKKKWKNTKKSKPWYDNTCRQLKKQLQHLARKMNPATRRSLQQEYFALKKKYKKQVKLMHKKYKNDLINGINALSSERTMNAVKAFGGRSTNSEKKVRSKKKPSYLRKHGYNIFDSYFMITMK